MAERTEIEQQLCAAVGQLLTPPRPADAVAPRAQLRRLGFGVPEFEALEHAVHARWGVVITIHTDCTIAAIADVVCEALNRRSAA